MPSNPADRQITLSVKMPYWVKYKLKKIALDRETSVKEILTEILLKYIEENG